MAHVRSNPECAFRDIQLKLHLDSEIPEESEGQVRSLFDLSEPVLPLANNFSVKAYIDGEEQLKFDAKDKAAIEAHMRDECGGHASHHVWNGRVLTVFWTDNLGKLFTVKAIKAGV